MTAQDSPNFFDELNIGKIKAHVITLAGKYNEDDLLIRRVALYRAGNGFPVGVKYVMLLEISSGDLIIPPKKKDDKKVINMSQIKFFKDMIGFDGGSAFLDESECSKFYKSPPHGYMDEWQLKAKISRTKNDFHIIQESELVLYVYSEQNDKNTHTRRKNLPVLKSTF